MDNRVKRFIEENIYLIENNQWEEVYNVANREFIEKEISEFTIIMLDATIDPLKYMNLVPSNYLYSSNISGDFIIPNNITGIGYAAFCYCSGLTGITIPDNVMNISSNAFFACDNLTKVVIGAGVTNIGSLAFCLCTSLTNITIPGSITSINEETFMYCAALIDIEIPEGVTSIGYRAFSNCSSLTSITIPSSIEYIRDEVFLECEQLKKIYYKGTLKLWAKVNKKKNWNNGSKIEKIHCSDGTVEVELF